MRILDVRPGVANRIEKVNINDIEYHICIFFEDKINGEIQPIPWNTISIFRYVDDIANIGVAGEMAINNTGAILDKFLKNSKQYFLGIYMKNTNTGFEENFYFSIVTCIPMAEMQSNDNCVYSLQLVEVFVAEGMYRNFRIMEASQISDTISSSPLSYIASLSGIYRSHIVTSLTERSMISLAEFTISLIKSNMIDDAPETAAQSFTITNAGVKVEVAAPIAHTFNVNDKSFESFKSDHPTTELGEIVYENIGKTESCTDVLSMINKNLYFRDGSYGPDSTEIGDSGTIRSENISKLVLDTTKYSPRANGHRDIIVRSHKDTFSKCFQENTLYEAFVDTQLSKGEIQQRLQSLKYQFLSPAFFTKVAPYPVNRELTVREWCNCVVSPDNEEDAMSAMLFRIKPIVKIFEETYLKSKFTSNIKIKPQDMTSLSRRIPLYNEERLNYVYGAKLLRTLYTLNTILRITLPGANHRKANEMVYIDNKMSESKKGEEANSDATQAVYTNAFNAKYYFTTRVVHSFAGQKYTNDLFLCSFISDDEESLA